MQEFSKSRFRSAAWGWILIGGVVVWWELTCDPGNLLSEGVDRALESHPVATRAAIVVTAAHLANCMDGPVLRFVDPFKWVGWLSRRAS